LRGMIRAQRLMKNEIVPYACAETDGQPVFFARLTSMPPVNVTVVVVKVEPGEGVMIGGSTWAAAGVTPPLARKARRTQLTKTIRTIRSWGVTIIRSPV